MQTKQIKYQIVIIFTLGVYLYYLTYRLRYTINHEALLLFITQMFMALFLCFSLHFSYGIREREGLPLHFMMYQ